MAAKKKGGNASGKQTPTPSTWREPVRTPINMTSPDAPIYNTFTKSYTTRHVVHGSRAGDLKTLCGREIVSVSDAPFLTEVDGSCLKCRKKIEVEERTHPGWVDV